MIDKKFIEKLKKEHEEANSERRQIISLANVILHDSKRVIFSLHRDDTTKAEASLTEIDKVIMKLEEKFGPARLKEEGSYKAALEEYVEAKTFYLVVTGKKIEKFKNMKIDFDTYLGGLCDLSGELVRRATNKAAAGSMGEVRLMHEYISEILAELVEFDMTGYLRTKYDQARGNLRKMEQINYEISLRK
jgi:predicted translin family RNA/ssDNA-binding protein